MGIYFWYTYSMKAVEELKKCEEALLIVPSYLIAFVVCIFILMWCWNESCTGLGCLAGALFVPITSAIVSVPVSFFIYLIFKKLPKIVKKILIMIGTIVFILIILLVLFSLVSNFLSRQ